MPNAFLRTIIKLKISEFRKRDYFRTIIRKLQVEEFYSRSSDMKNLPVPKKLKFLKPSLTLIDEESVPVDKEKLVTFTLKLKAAATGRSSQNATNTYKLAVRHFEEGTAWEFITVLGKLEEIWRQKSVTTATDKEVVIKSVLNGDSLTQFVTGVTSGRQTVQADRTTVETALDMTHID